jgi:SIR2-like protein/NACHT domain-containing protein
VADRATGSAIHKKKICFLLGAGADISSGGITFADLKREAVEEFSKQPLFDITLPEEIEARFESIFIQLGPDERALMVEWIFRRLQPLAPSDAYKLLVLLAEAGGIDAVVTTNFDLMLEAAQSELGREPFQVFAPGIARPYLLSYTRFDLPKKPYLKLHGDLASRSVVLLTASDLEQSNYDSSMMELLVSVLQTHDLVLVGYSGSDKALARVIAEATEETTNLIFWCAPHAPSIESPLYSRINERSRFIRIGFDELMLEVARPVLERPSLAATRPTYLRCLFDWRVDYCNREYVHAYGERSGKSLVDVFARRRGIEERLAMFLQPNRPLAVIAGPSGFGKTTIGIRLYKTWRSDTSKRVLLIRSQALPESGDIEQYISDQLGGLGASVPFSLFHLEEWLRENNQRLILYIDGINEFSPKLERCLQCFRSILRFCYFLPEAESTVKVIVTVRQETWNAMLQHIDLTQLRKTIWLEGGAQDAFSTIACGPLTDEELQDALSRLREHGYASIDSNLLTPGVESQLRDPYLLGMIAEAAHEGLPPMPSARVYERSFETKLRRRASLIESNTLKDILASVALHCLSVERDTFREIDINPIVLRGEVIRLMKDLNVFKVAGQGLLRFDHDRTFEYFLALGLASGISVTLETISDLQQYLKRFRSETKAIGAARLFFELRPKERFPLISTSLQLLDNQDDDHSQEERELLFGFARDVLVEMTEQQDELAMQYLSDSIDAARLDRVGEHHLRTVVQSAASLPSERAIPLLTRVAHVTSSLARTEANIYATDKLVKQYLLSKCPIIGLLNDSPYAEFFGDQSLASWQRLGRLIGFAAQLGPDNTHPDEYQNTLTVLNAALDQLLREQSWTADDAANLSAFFLANCDRLLYNSTPHQIGRFFGNPKRKELAGILDKLANGAVLVEADLQAFEPYAQTLTADVEYSLSHALFILSSFNDLEATLQLAEARYALFTNKSFPEEVDFFLATLLYIHLIHNLPYDETRFGWWERIILDRWPDILLHRPGLERGERRGFQDPFDRVFEDGFTVLYPYGVLRPSLERRTLRYKEYRQQLTLGKKTTLPLYAKYLDDFLRNNRIEEALQVLQALAAVIVTWPTEGLLALQNVIGSPEPRIRRATIRILAEAFNRHPEETVQFLKSSGAVISDEDLFEIKVRQEVRIGRRQVEVEEWARIGYFLFQRPGAREAFVSCLRTLLKANSFEDAFSGILNTLGLTGQRDDRIDR